MDDEKKIVTKLFERFGFKSTQVLAGDGERGRNFLQQKKFEVSNEHEKSNYILSVCRFFVKYLKEKLENHNN